MTEDQFKQLSPNAMWAHLGCTVHREGHWRTITESDGTFVCRGAGHEGECHMALLVFRKQQKGAVKPC